MANFLMDVEASQHELFSKIVGGPRGTDDYYHVVWLYRLMRCCQKDIATVLAEKLGVPKDSEELRRSPALRWSSELDCLKPLLARMKAQQPTADPTLSAENRFDAVPGPYQNGLVTLTPEGSSDPANEPRVSTPIFRHPAPPVIVSPSFPLVPVTPFPEALIAHPSPTPSRASTVAAFQLLPFAVQNTAPSVSQFRVQREQAKESRLKADNEENRVREAYQAALLDASRKAIEEAIQRDKDLQEQVTRDNDIVLEERRQRDERCRDVEGQLIVLVANMENTAREIEKLKAEIGAERQRRDELGAGIKKRKCSGLRDLYIHL